MHEINLIFGAIYGGISVILGAFGAHALKNRMSEDLLKSFETGVKYQMYHALALLFLNHLNYFHAFETDFIVLSTWCFIIGTFLFSFSIYGLCITAMLGNKWRFLGPVTPLGGSLLVAGWVFLALSV